MSNVIKASDATRAWLQSDQGIQALTARAQDSIRILSETGLSGRLQSEWESSRAGGTKVFRIGNSLRALSSELTILVLAHQSGIKIAPEVWQAARTAGSLILALNNLSFQGRIAAPPTRADLWTADIGVNVAVTGQFDSPLEWNNAEVSRFLEVQSVRPIRAEWLDDATRIHSLDTMGHNWWSVIVGGAGVIESLLGRTKQALEISAQLQKWFTYPGNIFYRKTRNFGVEGDFVEGFSYGEYALLHPLVLAFLLPEYPINPNWLSSSQCQGLAAWYKKAFLKKSDGSWWPQRFGDIHFSYNIRAEVWHTLSRLTGDEELLAMAHKLKPCPRRVFEFLMWEPLPQTSSKPKSKPVRVEKVRVYPTSGLAFLGEEHLSLTVRAGEYWNHNHHDAGSFIFHQNGVVWVDDCGCCVYSQPEYVDYYTTPRAHNVAYAPDLAPPIPRTAFNEGVHLPGKLLFHGRERGVEVLGTDTQVLSGGGLARSHRLLLVLDDAAMVVWDDLQGYHPQSFDFLLHTTCGLRPSDQEPTALQSAEDGSCPFSFYSENPASFSVEAAAMGELSRPDAYSHGDPLSALQGKCLKWKSEKALRQKFGLTMGTTIQSAQWKTIDSGWENSFQIGAVRWSIWFNRKADGRSTHQNSIETWQGIETEAYALLLREEEGRKTLYAIQASFLRREGTVIQGSLQRSILTRTDL